jgi:hypothetical protein
MYEWTWSLVDKTQQKWKEASKTDKNNKIKETRIKH